MILDSKSFPPPPYVSSSSIPKPTLSTLPPHILLHIIYLTFPQVSLHDQSKPARQRRALYWLAISLRLVDRTFYASCMHILRSMYLPYYDKLVRPPYTSDPFPLIAPGPSSSSQRQSPYGPSSSTSSTSIHPSPLSTLQRETPILDKFIALKVREDVWADDSDLHLEREEAYRDLFYHAQPKARLEDLVRVFGEERGVVCVGPPPPLPKTRGQSAGARDSSRSEVSSLASMSSVTLVPVPGTSPQTQPPLPNQPNADTDSKPRLFSPGSPYYNDASTTPTYAPTSPSPTTSNVSLPLTPPIKRISPKPSNSKSLFAIFSRSKRSPQADSISMPSPPTSPIATTSHQPLYTLPLPISALSVTLAPRTASLSLVLSNPSSSPSSSSSLRLSSAAGMRRTMTIAETARARDEPLENVARRLVDVLVLRGDS